MLLANGLSTCPIKGNPVLSNGLKSLPKNPPDYHILCNWIFEDFKLAQELFPKALVSNNLCRKFFSSLESPTTFDEIFKVTVMPFFIF